MKKLLVTMSMVAFVNSGNVRAEGSDISPELETTYGIGLLGGMGLVDYVASGVEKSLKTLSHARGKAPVKPLAFERLLINGGRVLAYGNGFYLTGHGIYRLNQENTGGEVQLLSSGIHADVAVTEVQKKEFDSSDSTEPKFEPKWRSVGAH